MKTVLGPTRLNLGSGIEIRTACERQSNRPRIKTIAKSKSTGEYQVLRLDRESPKTTRIWRQETRQRSQSLKDKRGRNRVQVRKYWAIPGRMAETSLGGCDLNSWAGECVIQVRVVY